MAEMSTYELDREKNNEYHPSITWLNQLISLLIDSVTFLFLEI
jgi:hypothetical protein